jgi:hydrogenase/urease accessory protein HupE
MFFLKSLRAFFIACISFSFLQQARAHQVDSVELEFQQTEDAWILRGLLDISYMIPEMRGVPDALPLMRLDVMAQSKSQHALHTQQAERLMRQLLVLKFNGETLGWTITFPDFQKEPLVLPEETGGWALMNAVIRAEPQARPGKLEVFWKDNLSSELIIMIVRGEEMDLLSVFSGMSNTLLEIKSPAASSKKSTSLPSKITQTESWIISGFKHVIPLGLDHILFILGLFLLAPRWKPLLGQSLLFTIAHSITLALATFSIINLPSLLVEVSIAASIAWIGFENLVVKKLKPSRLYLVFSLGLLHGLGFASVLGDKIAGLKPDQLVLPLISFNIGVEIAQITVLIAAFIVLIPVRKWTVGIQKIGSALIGLVGLFWVYERLFL